MVDKMDRAQALRLVGTLAVVMHVRDVHANDPLLQDVSVKQLRQTQPCCIAVYDEAVRAAATVK